MKFDDIQEGRYQAKIKDWGIRDVEKLKTIEAFVQFDVSVGNEICGLTWKGLFLKKDGTPNKKTYDTLKTCGFKGKTVDVLTQSGSLDNTKTYDVTLKRENGFLNIEWVNDPAAVATSRVADVKTLQGYDLSKINAELVKMNMNEPTAKPLKNYAPTMDADEKLPF
jgi:hypothetical protein